jgi:hypothetical protein
MEQTEDWHIEFRSSIGNWGRAIEDKVAGGERVGHGDSIRMNGCDDIGSGGQVLSAAGDRE